jgi:23S rRNA (cytidine1920-2'-O)/16S rRNA (cytidine1409-2'-O)-methyltransferase
LKKIRLDQILAGRELAADPKEAAAFVMAGLVFSGERRLEKPGELLAEDAPLSVRAKEHPYVGRGGLKLAAALAHWKLDVRGLRCLDLGSSTGGFTDCLLQNGAASVVAVDSGTNQLDWKLRKDPRVRSLENTSALGLAPEAIGGAAQFACMDLSFMRLEKAFPSLKRLILPGASWVALVKPQFELKKNEVPAGGVVQDAALQRRAVDEVIAAASRESLGPFGSIPSPIHGRDGNIEFLVLGRLEELIQT